MRTDAFKIFIHEQTQLLTAFKERKHFVIGMYIYICSQIMLNKFCCAVITTYQDGMKSNENIHNDHIHH